MIQVRFRYMTSVRSASFRNAMLVGSWDEEGRHSTQWSSLRPMSAELGDDGCPSFACTAEFADDQVGKSFDWGAILAGPGGPKQWGIATELDDPFDARRHRSFVLQADTREVEYRLSYGRWLGARKQFSEAATPGLRFRVWAPYARRIDVVFSRTDHGYVADDGSGIDPDRAPIALARSADGMWTR